jgi:microcystin-dependent protein
VLGWQRLEFPVVVLVESLMLCLLPEQGTLRHNHGVSDPGHTHSYSNNTNDQTVTTVDTGTAADETNTSATTGSSTTGITINNAGGGEAHNNMPPYIVLNYIINWDNITIQLPVNFNNIGRNNRNKKATNEEFKN